MSRGQTPRTPRYFPRMKVRGRRRRRIAPFQRMARGFDLLGDAIVQAAQEVGKFRIAIDAPGRAEENK